MRVLLATLVVFLAAVAVFVYRGSLANVAEPERQATPLEGEDARKADELDELLGDLPELPLLPEQPPEGPRDIKEILREQREMMAKAFGVLEPDEDEVRQAGEFVKLMRREADDEVDFLEKKLKMIRAFREAMDGEQDQMIAASFAEALRISITMRPPAKEIPSWGDRLPLPELP